MLSDKKLNKEVVKDEIFFKGTGGVPNLFAKKKHKESIFPFLHNRVAILLLCEPSCINTSKGSIIRQCERPDFPDFCVSRKTKLSDFLIRI